MENQPKVYRVETESMNGNNVWDLLTTDGNDPNNTFYYFLNGDAPSNHSQDQINEKLENEEWEEMSVEESGNEISDWNID